jgi:hypothetical protein
MFNEIQQKYELFIIGNKNRSEHRQKEVEIVDIFILIYKNIYNFHLKALFPLSL